MGESKQKVPLYECDEHNEVFYFWQKAKYKHYFDRPLDLFHIDAHNDINLPRLFKKSVYFSEQLPGGYLEYYKDFARNELEIASFILPAVLAGLVRNVYFIYPKWRRMKPTRKKMNISSVLGEGKALNVGIEPNRSPRPELLLRALPDLKYFNYYAHGIERIPLNRKVILDIDLDYFACRDSIGNNLSYELEITREQFLGKDVFLHNKTLPFSGIDFSFEEKNNMYYCKIARKKVRDTSHLPSKGEIESEIDTLVTTLDLKKIKPLVITICRSSISGYCPEGYYDFIEHKLKQKLKYYYDI